MKNQSCDGFPGSVTQSGGSAEGEMCPSAGGQQGEASPSDRMMVTTDTDGKRRQGKGEERMRRVQVCEKGKMKLRWVEPLCFGERGHYGAEEWVALARSLINTAAPLPASYSVPSFYYSTFTFNLFSLSPLSFFSLSLPQVR
jgi:hypothetical protein